MEPCKKKQNCINQYLLNGGCKNDGQEPYCKLRGDHKKIVF